MIGTAPLFKKQTTLVLLKWKDWEGWHTEVTHNCQTHSGRVRAVCHPTRWLDIPYAKQSFFRAAQWQRVFPCPSYWLTGQFYTVDWSVSAEWQGGIWDWGGHPETGHTWHCNLPLPCKDTLPDLYNTRWVIYTITLYFHANWEYPLTLLALSEWLYESCRCNRRVT